MTLNQKAICSLADVLAFVEASDLSPTRRRDMLSAINRTCTMAGKTPATVNVDPATLRELVNDIRPALHDVSDKTWANLRSLFVAALELAGVIDSMGRGVAVADAEWGLLMAAIKHDKRLFCGLAAFANWCVGKGFRPGEVDNPAVKAFLLWLETRTLSPRPRDVARRVPNIWNEARDKIAGWPHVTLNCLSFRAPPKRTPLNDLAQSFREDLDAYCSMRGNSDIFDDRPGRPRKPLKPGTVRLQREQLHSAASVLIEKGIAVEAVVSLATLVAFENFKTILRHFHDKADHRPSAFLDSLGRTLIQVGQYHVGLPDEEIAMLKRLRTKLPAVPFDLTAKNKALLTRLESERLRGKLIFLPEKMVDLVLKDLKDCRLRFVWAQVAVSIAVLLAAPLRAQNLSNLHWARHFSEPDGPKGRLILHIPKQETKTGRSDYVAEVPTEVAKQLRWYRGKVMPMLGADPNGFLFVSKGGGHKTQETLSEQITEAIANHVGVHMTPHQFRHFAAILYLEARPEDFETVRNLLGHSWSKTTSIYAGSSTRRAGKAYGKAMFEQREALKFLGNGKRPRRRDIKKVG